MSSKKLIDEKQVTPRRTNAKVTVDIAATIKDTYNNIASDVTTGLVHFNENAEQSAMASKTEKSISKDNNIAPVQVTTSDAVGTVDANDVSSTAVDNNNGTLSSSSKEQGLTDVTIMSDLTLGSVVATHGEDLTINETLLAAVPPVVIYTTE